MNIGKKLRKFRSINGVSLRDAAKYSGIDHSTISRIESGFIKDPKFCDVVILCKLYGADIKELL